MKTDVWRQDIVVLNGELFIVASGSYNYVHLSHTIVSDSTYQLFIMTTSDDRRCANSRVLGIEGDASIICRVSRPDLSDQHDPYFAHYRMMCMRTSDQKVLHKIFECGFMMRSTHEIAASLY